MAMQYSSRGVHVISVGLWVGGPFHEKRDEPIF